jgi:hypothetical protein
MSVCGTCPTSRFSYGCTLSRRKWGASDLAFRNQELPFQTQSTGLWFVHTSLTYDTRLSEITHNRFRWLESHDLGFRRYQWE